MGFLEQIFKIKKSKNTEHPCTFVQLLLFEYFVLLYCTIETNRLSHHLPIFLGPSV